MGAGVWKHVLKREISWRMHRVPPLRMTHWKTSQSRVNCFFEQQMDRFPICFISLILCPAPALIYR